MILIPNEKGQMQKIKGKQTNFDASTGTEYSHTNSDDTVNEEEVKKGDQRKRDQKSGDKQEQKQK